MIKSISKILLASSIAAISLTSLNAKNIVCYKNNTKELANIENIPFDGDGCNGENSISQMKQNGWKVIDIKVETSNDTYNYKYLLSDQKASTKTKYKTSFNPEIITAIIPEIEDNKSTINIPNLNIGQSGIVIHKYDNSKNIIVSNAKVVSSNNTSSVIEFFKYDGLEQSAIPTTNRKAQKGDILALNYMYNNSLLITPSQEVFQAVRKKFPGFTFEHSDLFGAFLKFDGTPKPTILDIQKYAKSKDLGTIFVVADQKVNILDTNTLNILDSYYITYDDTNSQMPFYTRVEDINSIIPEIDSIKGIVSKLISTIKDEEETKNIDSENYESYYKYQIGL